MSKEKQRLINRDISWLSFNARVLQEAEDKTVPLLERIKFLGIYSNNYDEFFRIRVAVITRMRDYSGSSSKLNRYDSLLSSIQKEVILQHKKFSKIWRSLIDKLRENRIFFKTNYNLNKEQKRYVTDYFDNEVSSHVIPLMFSAKKDEMPYLVDASIFLAVKMNRSKNEDPLYAIVEVPSNNIGRFVKLPSPSGQQHIILLEDVIRYNLPKIFSFFNVNSFSSHIFKVTKDYEIDIEASEDSDYKSFASKVQKAIKNRRKGKPVRFVFHSLMDTDMKKLLIKKINKFGNCNVMPGGRIHNFKDFIKFDKAVDYIEHISNRLPPFNHATIKNSKLKIMDLVSKEDILLHFPYHSFVPIIDMLREAAMDDSVISIKITLYRVAGNSKIINALINAARNGVRVFVVIELKARFSEEDNLEWKDTLEQEGIEVSVGIRNMKVHSKMCLIECKNQKHKTYKYGFISTGNLNEDTAKFYCDHCLMTSDKKIVTDIDRLFKYIKHWTPKTQSSYPKLSNLIMSPIHTRVYFLKLIENEIKYAKKGHHARMIIKLNGLNDPELIHAITRAIKADVQVDLIIRGNFRLRKEAWMDKKKYRAISIVDEHLEHSRIIYFYNKGEEKMFISSADWMHRNLDVRIEMTTPIKDKDLIEQLKKYLKYQLSDNVKARILDEDLSNHYYTNEQKPFRSQKKIHQFLKNITK